jgi:hypothetical protein
MTKFVQLKPYDKKKGHLLQRLTVRSKRMSSGRWYKVTDEFANELSKIRQPYPPGSVSMADPPLAFSIVGSKKEQLEIEKANKPKPPVEKTEDLTGNDLKTTDLTGGTKDPFAKPAEKSSSAKSRRKSS